MGGCSQKRPSASTKCLVLAGGTVLATGRLQHMQLNGNVVQQIGARTTEAVVPNFAAGKGHPDGATQLSDGRCWVLLPRAATPGGGGANCHDQQAANAFRMQDGLRKSPPDVLQPTAAQTWGILPTTAELIPEILPPSYTYMDEDVVGEAG